MVEEVPLGFSQVLLVHIGFQALKLSFKLGNLVRREAKYAANGGDPDHRLIHTITPLHAVCLDRPGSKQVFACDVGIIEPKSVLDNGIDRLAGDDALQHRNGQDDVL